MTQPRTLADVPDIRFITDDEVPAFHRAIPFGFGDDLTDEEGGHDRFRELFPLETCIGAFEGDRVVATFGSFAFDLTVPGGSVPMAGTTVVTVQPTHRRRGVLSTMMRMHLDQAIELGQPVAGLWASETPIYGRFGYGLAAHSHELTVPTDRVSLPGGPDSVSLIDTEHAIDVLPDIYERVQRATPGMFGRSESWWRHRRLRDPEHWRGGASSLRIGVAYRETAPVGYVAYRQKEKWGNGIPDGSVKVVEAFGLDDDARRTLWSYLTGIDLFPSVTWWNAPSDNPLYEEVDNIRHLTTRHIDTLWLRILDMPVALSARTYEEDGTITIGVVDEFLDRDGVVRLDVRDGRGTCSPSTDEPDVTLSVSDLSSLYLGRPSAIAKGRAGRISGDPSAVRTLDRLMRTAQAPFCAEVF